jgi:hypothetical protein
MTQRPSFLREQAQRCLRLARSTSDQMVSDRLTALAAEYLDSAQTLERLAAARPSVPPVTPEQRPAQQQQQIQPSSKKEEDE